MAGVKPLASDWWAESFLDSTGERGVGLLVRIIVRDSTGERGIRALRWF